MVMNSSASCVGACTDPYGSPGDPKFGCNGCTKDVNPNLYTVYARPLHDGSVAIGLLNRQPPPPPPPAPLPAGVKRTELLILLLFVHHFLSCLCCQTDCWRRSKTLENHV